MKQQISTESNSGIGPYSPALLVDDTLYISGQIALDPQSGECIPGTGVEQCRVVMNNIGGLLKAAGMDYQDLVHCRIFLKQMGDYASINPVYESFLAKPYPARAAVEVSALPKDAAIEIEAIARKSR